MINIKSYGDIVVGKLEPVDSEINLEEKDLVINRIVVDIIKNVEQLKNYIK